MIIVENNEIKSRWFVIDCDFVMKGQYKMTFHRDVIADNYEAVINAPTFIEKATLENTDPLIFNSENMTFNQIKTSETLLKDKSGCPWIVGYTTNDKIEATINNLDNPADIVVDGPLSSWKFGKYVNQELHELTDLTVLYFIYDQFRNSNYKTVGVEIDLNRTKWDRLKTYSNNNPDEFDFKTKQAADWNYIFNTLVAQKNTFKDAFFALAKAKDSKLVIGNELDELKLLNGKTIQYIDGGTKVKKRINFTGFIGSGDQFNLKTTEPADAAAISIYQSQIKQFPVITGTFEGKSRYYEWDTKYNKFTFELQDTTVATYNFTTGESGIRGLEDAPYSMFCMPYGDKIFKNINFNGETVQCSSSKYLNLKFASVIAEQAGTKLYDLQLVPYCPVPELIDAEGNIDLVNTKPVDDYNFITSGNALITVVVYPHKSSFTFDIPLEEPITITEPKVQSECDMYRLCSPNFNGTFEFNAAKNGGVNKFNVDITYLPYNPYIHINPDFNNLYGSDFNDARGLICGGDFSLARVDDAWVQYQNNNKNYQNIFNRQIQNMSFNNKYQHMADTINAAVGAVQGGVSGGIMGGLGGGIGTGIGAAVGFGASAIAGAADVAINDKLRQEAIDYTKDQFGYQLGNIKAIPDSLAKTTAYTLNNKFFPVLEYYTCKDREKEALREKIKYNGMTVMVVGKISDYIKSEPSYIKGKLIRIEDLNEDFHMLNAISGEVNKGFFI